MMPDVNIYHGKMSDFASFPWFFLLIKLRNFDFEGHQNT